MRKGRQNNELPSLDGFARLVKPEYLDLVLSIPFTEVFEPVMERWLLNMVAWVLRHKPTVHLVNVSGATLWIRENTSDL
jgi:hypothetical protein